jgi:acyl-CoA thioesterase
MTPNEVVAKMMEYDAFSQWLGIQVIEVKHGYSKIKMIIRPEMVNGFGIIHGGVTFAFGDSAFAFACNNGNKLSVALDVNISFTKAVMVGDELIATATTIHSGRSTGVYQININNQNNELVASFKGTCFRNGNNLF